MFLCALRGKNEEYVPFLLLNYPRNCILRVVSLKRQEHAGECQLFDLAARDLPGRAWDCFVKHYLLSGEKRACCRTETTQLGQFPAGDCHRWHRIWISAGLSLWLENRYCCSAGQRGGFADFGPRSDICFQRQPELGQYRWDYSLPGWSGDVELEKVGHRK